MCMCKYRHGWVVMTSIIFCLFMAFVRPPLVPRPRLATAPTARRVVGFVSHAWRRDLHLRNTQKHEIHGVSNERCRSRAEVLIATIRPVCESDVAQAIRRPIAGITAVHSGTYMHSDLQGIGSPMQSCSKRDFGYIPEGHRCVQGLIKGTQMGHFRVSSGLVMVKSLTQDRRLYAALVSYLFLP
ncbi:hypothetical protein BGZ61DRAFT_443193 [Ilyonectria robusta]|uniref:uncharacterized protein n=1 Tax=Ilyonectria robusta TaxID=1079257 RepID=UPI001E8EB655|nr:uncharacterized protein BGZ61DRAFT_443193 [Ilyonectria robusta]KAH8734820.1 hypothetical protein BGZ61DRAFT_443193 [Ilyonectria robusta]